MPNITSLFSTAERGGGSPVELYTFQRGTKVWRYTSAQATQTVSGISFTPADLKRSAIEQKKDTPGIQFTIAVDLETPLGQDLIAFSGEPVIVTYQRSQSSGTPIMPVIVGRTIQVKFSDDQAELTVATVEYDFKQMIPKVVVQRSCPWTLYSPPCGVDKASYATTATVSSVTTSNGSYVLGLSASQTSGYWTNGVIVLDQGGAPLFVAAHTGSNVTIWGDVPSGLVVGSGLTIYAGCDKMRSTCVSKFNNLANFGGFPDLPAKNPSLVKLEKQFAPGAINP